MENTANTVQYRHTAGLEVHEADDGLIVFNPTTDKVHHLNGSAGVMFELCHQTISLHRLAEQIQHLYELDTLPEQETREGVAQLLKEGVLIASDAE